MDGACLARWKLPEFSTAWRCPTHFYAEVLPSSPNTSMLPPQQQKKNSKPTNGKKTDKTTPSILKLILQKKTKQHQTKTERYFLTPYPSSLKLSMYSRHFVGGYLLVDPPPRPSAYLEFPRKVYHESPLKWGWSLSLPGKKKKPLPNADLPGWTKAVWEIWGVSCDWICVSGWLVFYLNE